MDHPVGKTFHEVQGTPHANVSLATKSQSVDTSKQESITLVSCVCGSMDSCPFLLLCLQGSDVEMNDVQPLHDRIGDR